MKQLKFLSLSSLIFALLPIQSIAQKLVTDNAIVPLQKTNGNPHYTVMNINNLTMSVRRNGILGRVMGLTLGQNEYGYGIKYPKGTAEVIYADGILYGGVVYDGKVVNFRGDDYLIRLQGSRYSRGLLSGRIIEKGITEDPDDPDVRIWRIRRDWQTADLTEDAAEFYKIPQDSISQEQIDSSKIRYEKDWREWPWQKGAPFYDSNENGILDNGEEPGIANADQVIWCVANDTYVPEYFYSPPFGMEMQVTYWAYNRSSPVSDAALSRINEASQHIIFKHVRLIYKGCIDTPDTAHIDSMYIGQWVDPDVGYAGDDLVGCDTTLSLGYGYNSTSQDQKFMEYKLYPPAIGYVFLQGPIVPSKGDIASFNMEAKKDYINLFMSSFAYIFYNGIYDPATPNYLNTTIKYYKMLKGFAGLTGIQVYFTHPPGMTPGPFPLAGDPVNSVGHIDGQGTEWSPVPGDRRFICSSGPFTMALGDTQEVIIAIVGGLGADRLSSISVMKYHARLAHILAENNFNIGFKEDVIPDPEPEPIPQDYFMFQNYPNPFNASTEIHYNLPAKRLVKLAIYNMLGQTVKVLTDGIQEARSYAIKWDGTNMYGEPVPSGLYLYRLETGSVVFTKKLMLLR